MKQREKDAKEEKGKSGERFAPRFLFFVFCFQHGRIEHMEKAR